MFSKARPQPPQGRAPLPGALWPRVGFVALVVALLCAFYALGWQDYLSWTGIKTNLHHWQDITRHYAPLSILLYFAAFTVATSLSLPVAFVLSILCGALFDWWLGVGVASLASTTGSALSFLSSRYLFRAWVRRRFGPQLARIDRGVARDGAWYLFSLRLTPVVPFFLVNLGMALTPMRLFTFAVVSWLGMLPVKCILVSAGSTLAAVEDPQDILSLPLLMSLTALGVAPLILRLLARRIRLRRTKPRLAEATG